MKSVTLLKFMIITLFIMAYMGVYTFTTKNKESRINALLKQQIDILHNNYRVALSRFDTITDLTKERLFKNKIVLNILYQAKHTQDKEKRALLRKELLNLLKPEFQYLQKFGVNMMLFAFENNKTFLRVHKPEKFDDNLSQVRYSFTYVNSQQKKISGFEEGKISHAFRNVTPLFYKGEYIGSVDLSFSSEIIQESMKALHHLDTHFILNKGIFDSNIWKSENEIHYLQSIEHEHFLFALTPSQNITAFSQEKLDIINVLKDKIADKIKTNKAFALYFHKDSIAYSIAFVPVKDIKDKKTVAYLVSYNKNFFLENMITEYYLINLISFVVLSLLALLFYRNIQQK